MANADNTKISIINMALKSVKLNTISSPAEPTETARVCNLYYDKARRASLRACDWHWATVKGHQLNLLGSYNNAIANPDVQADQDFVPGWQFLYGMPAKVCRVQKVYNSVVPPVVPFTFAMLPWDDDDFFYSDPYGRQNDFLLCRSPITNIIAIASQLQDSVLDYTQDIEDTTQFDDMFVEGFSLMLAAKIVLPLTADRELKQLVQADAQAFFDEAKRKNGGESTERGPRYSDWEKCRN